MKTPIEKSIPFKFEGIKGRITGVNKDWVLYGGMGFQRTSASPELQAAMNKAEVKNALDESAIKLDVDGKDCIISGFKKYIKVTK